MTLTIDLDLNIMKMYLQFTGYGKNEVCGSRHSKVRQQTGHTKHQKTKFLDKGF